MGKNVYGKIFTIEKVSETARIYYFDPRHHDIDDESIEDLAFELSRDTNNSVTLIQDNMFILRGILIAFMNPLTTRSYVPNQVDEYLTKFFEERQIDVIDANELETDYDES